MDNPTRPGHRRLMEIPGEVVASVATGVAAVGIWLIRLEGKVKLQEAAHDGILTELQYIRGRVDAIYNGRAQE